jgi:hypothetical protein
MRSRCVAMDALLLHLPVDPTQLVLHLAELILMVQLHLLYVLAVLLLLLL